MIQKIVFLGAPSTGKSTLSEVLARRLNTLSVAEYGREYWIEHQVDRRLSPEQLLHIAQIQNQWEDAAETNANRYLFCDTNAFTTWHFACHYHTTPLPELSKLAHASWQRYDLVVLCDNDIPYDDTWERSGDANRSEFQQFLNQYLLAHGISFIKVSGTIESREAQVLSALTSLNTEPQQAAAASC
ncbi:MAG: ATP-binding protein [Paraglaciecola polaris]|uniref:ATP-binding protein n=1 Tax=Paraglaciecola polaris TaxID=222814 RepID=UPI0030021F20